jgi:flagellar export protein FliJ
MEKRFKLQKVLEYRNLMLEKEKARTAVLMQEERNIIETIRGMNQEIRIKREEADGCGTDFVMAGLYKNYIAHLEKTRLAEQKKLAEHRQILHKQKWQTIAAYKRKTIMDKLKEKHTAEYGKYADKEETKSAEDMVLTRRVSKLNNDGE